jgi:ketosteroid isomerase-like protein
MIKLISAAAALAVLAGSQALAADLTPEEIVHRHVEAGNKGDSAAMAADYAEDAVVLQPGQAVEGKAAIGATFARLFGPGAPKLTITPTKIWSQGDVGFVTWEANGGAIKGTDSFLVRGGKILVQAVFIGGAPPPPPPAAK